MIFNIKVNEDKTVEYSEIIVNQYENEIDQLEFVLPFADFSYVGVFKSPNNKKLEIPVIDNKIIIDKNITSIAGQEGFRQGKNLRLIMLKVFFQMDIEILV